MGIFDRIERRLRSVLIIANYELAGLSFDQSRVQKCSLSAISLQDRCERRWRRNLREHDRPFHPPPGDPYLAASPLRRFLARVSSRVSFSAPGNLVAVIILGALFTTFQSRHALLSPGTG